MRGLEGIEPANTLPKRRRYMDRAGLDDEQLRMVHDELWHEDPIFQRLDWGAGREAYRANWIRDKRERDGPNWFAKWKRDERDPAHLRRQRKFIETVDGNDIMRTRSDMSDEDDDDYVPPTRRLHNREPIPFKEIPSPGWQRLVPHFDYQPTMRESHPVDEYTPDNRARTNLVDERSAWHDVKRDIPKVAKPVPIRRRK